ncbi:MAG: acetamidase/formamidase family protein [Chitinophagales bacterium]
MKKIYRSSSIGAILLFGLFLFLDTYAQQKAPDTIDEYWLFRIDYIGNPMYKVVKLNADQGKLEGQYVNENTRLKGKLEKNKYSLETLSGEGNYSQYEGEYTNGKINGNVLWKEPVTGKSLESHWTAVRFPMERPGPPKKYDFVPSAFHLGYSGDIPPALHCWPGDTVYTETVDCNGFDRQGIHKVMEGNAEIGPFYIESAIPGDVIAIHFIKIRLNRNWASSAEHLMSRSISHDYAAHAKLDESVVRWNLDLDKGMATLAGNKAGLKNYSLPVKPMLGCVGVAPAFGVYPFPAIDSGPIGGNMDFVLMNEGTTLYLPVFQPGALLFMGDGHALQGDGELNLDALETSLDVGFTVEIIRGAAAKLGQPRAENASWLMAIGLNGSLDEAFRDATTELANWLEHDYGLSPGETAIVLGTAIEYQITEVADRNVSVVAKIKKSTMAGIGTRGGK